MTTALKTMTDFIADFRAQIVELEALKDSTKKSDWVVKVGPLWIAFNMPGHTNPRACGVAQATVMSYAEAYRVGKWVQNGGGARGLPQVRRDAIEEQIESLKASIEFLSQQPVSA